jgi:WD40 repeat protein
LVYRGHSNPIYTIAWSPNSRSLASAEQDCVQIWEAATSNCQLTYPDFSGDTLEWPSNGTYLLTARDCIDVLAYGGKSAGAAYNNLSRTIYPRVDIWEAATGICQFRYEGQSVDEYMAWSPNGKVLAIIPMDSSEVHLLQVENV